MDLNEYASRKTAVNFSTIKKPVPENALKTILVEMRKRSQKTNSKQVESDSYEFGSMLDVGCGTGRITSYFAPFFKSFIGIDPSEFQIERAKETNSFKNVRFLVGSGEAMPVPNECADLALFVFSAFFMDFEKMEIEIVRVLTPNGLAILYGDMVQGIDLLDEDSRVVSIPDSKEKTTDLWNKYFQLFVDYAAQTNHPQRHVFDKYETMFQSLHRLNKRKVEDVRSFVYLNLKEFISIWNDAIPFFANFAQSQKPNPMKEFEEKFRVLCNISHVESKDINVRITYNSFMIFLDKII